VKEREREKKNLKKGTRDAVISVAETIVAPPKTWRRFGYRTDRLGCGRFHCYSKREERYIKSVRVRESPHVKCEMSDFFAVDQKPKPARVRALQKQKRRPNERKRETKNTTHRMIDVCF
jgi:hypothetical protein